LQLLNEKMAERLVRVVVTCGTPNYRLADLVADELEDIGYDVESVRDHLDAMSLIHRDKCASRDDYLDELEVAWNMVVDAFEDLDFQKVEEVISGS
jgi:hypothetical protein